jgi:predicted lipoprotein with Yx(FWY)xxD motif
MTQGTAPRGRIFRHRTRFVGTMAMAGVIAGTGGALVFAGGPVQAATGSSEAVVKVVNRAPFGKMLATLKGRSLYETKAACTGECLVIWPRLVLAAGKTTPTGVVGLGKAAFKVGTKTEYQVTYRGKRLYTFVDDSGTQVNGNGVAGFVVAKVT